MPRFLVYLTTLQQLYDLYGADELDARSSQRIQTRGSSKQVSEGITSNIT
jgi:hypothetical protein